MIYGIIIESYACLVKIQSLEVGMMLTYAKIANKPRILRSLTGLSPEAFTQLAYSFTQAYEAHLDEQDRQRQPHSPAARRRAEVGHSHHRGQAVVLPVLLQDISLAGGARALFRYEPTPGPFLDPSSAPHPEPGVGLQDATAGSRTSGSGARVGSLSGPGVHHRRHRVTKPEDILQAKQEGKLGIIFHFQNTDPVEDNLDLLRVYHRLGVRMIQRTYNRKNRVGDGCEERTDCGLSRFGIQLIREMNRLGIVVDLSHTGYKTTMEAIEISTAPPIFSHSNCNAVCESPRNITDDQIQAIAARGGVIGINGFPRFVAKAPRPTLDHFIVHIEHIVQLVGPDHAGLALDYYEGMASVATAEQAQAAYERHIASGTWTPESYPAPPWYYPAGLELPSGFPNLTKALVARGYSDEDIEKILGGNFLRIFRQVWREKP